MKAFGEPRVPAMGHAKVENHDPEVSLDLQLRAVFAAHPAARRDFRRLVEKWSAGARAPAAE